MNPSELEGDLREWGDEKEMQVKGLNALGYPSGQTESLSGSGKPPVPDYYPRHQIKALNGVIENMENEHKNILILIYALRLKDAEASRELGCHRSNIPKKLEKAKHLLIKSRYWKT